MEEMQDDTADDASGRERQRVQLLRHPTITKSADHMTATIPPIFSTSIPKSKLRVHPKPVNMPQLLSPIALRALRTLVHRPATTPFRRTLTTSTTTKIQPLTTRFNFTPVFRTSTLSALSFQSSKRQFSSSPIVRATYNQVRRGIRTGQRARRGRSPALVGTPGLKGVCLKTGITKPKKPNSGERKIARVRLSSGKIITAYIPGEGKNFLPILQLDRNWKCKGHLWLI